jgi:two-component system, OmpR family, phosphate regulon sensor histidine kinase PhoR
LENSFFILLFAVLTAFFAFRYYRLKQGLARATRSLLSQRLADISSAQTPLALRPLQGAIMDTVDEATLLLESERRQLAFQEALLNEIRDAIIILDENREIRFLNKTAQELFPSDQPYLARPFLEVCRDHRVYDTIELADEVGGKVSEHIHLRVSDTKGGRLHEITLLVEAEPLSLNGNGPGKTGAWIVMKDISKLLETEQIRQDFVANASHELRTPLSIINGYLETMNEEDLDLNSPIFKKAIGTMRKHSERISRIVDDMLTISKLEGASDLLTYEPFDLRESAEEIILQLMPIVEAHHAKITIKASADSSWVVCGDRFYWDQIFFNLIENALKQNPTPGLHITISFRSENGRHFIEIADDGIGIPAVDIPLVFKRFYRVQKHHARNQIKGTGLGLSIVKRAVEAHHGRIEVESQPGVRTAFTISIPQTRAKPATGTPA